MSAGTLHKLRNLLHSVLLVVGMALLVSLSVRALWGDEGVLWGLIAAGLVMALSLYRARLLSRADLPAVYAGLDELARRVDLPVTPRLYYLPSTMLNAFATGNRRAAAIAVTDGMLRSLTLLGVLAHEVSHIASGDLRIMNMADAMSRVTALTSYVGLFLLAVNLPLIALGLVAVPWLLVLLLLLASSVMSLLQLALSRTRDPTPILRRLGYRVIRRGWLRRWQRWNGARGRLWEGVLLPGRRVPGPPLLRTHPPTYERIHRLIQLREQRPVLACLGPTAGPVMLPAGWVPVQRRPRHCRSGLWS